MSDNQQDVTRVIKLKHPIPLGEGKSITELTIGRIKLKHLRALPQRIFDEARNERSGKGKKKEKNVTLTLNEVLDSLSALTGIEQKYLDEVDAEDVQAIVGELMSFINACLGEDGEVGKS
jgi:hypothetical protein